MTPAPKITPTTSNSLDVIRILAMIGVINLHTILAFSFRPDLFIPRLWLPLATISILSGPAVLLFFILSGFLTAGRSVEPRDNWRKICQRLFLPALVFICLYGILDWITQTKAAPSLLIPMLYSSILGIMDTSLWFLVVLGGAQLFAPLWQLLPARQQIWRYCLYCLLTLALVTSFKTLLQGQGDPSHGALPRALLYLFAYLYGGYCRYFPARRKFSGKCLLSIIIVVTGLQLAYQFCAQTNKYFSLQATPLTRLGENVLSPLVDVVLPLALALAVWQLLSTFDWHRVFRTEKSYRLWCQCCRYLARLSFAVYLWHPIWMVIRSRVLQFEYDFVHLPVFVYVTINWLFVFGTSLLCAALSDGLRQLRASRN